jgi:alkylation response protein AidB-like acyl-CoA dehydrogenase
VDLELTPDQRELRDVARQALDARAPLSLARAYLEREPSATPLHALLAELGWYTVGVEDDGFGLPGLVLLAREVGAHAAPSALVDTAVSARLLPLDGERSVALAVVESGADWTLGGVSTSFERAGDGWRVSGRKLGVQHGATAELLLVVGEADGGLAVGLVERCGTGVAVEAEAGVDPAAATVTVDLRDVAAEEVVPAGSALDAAFAVGAVATAAEGIGAASAALDLAIEYAREREQFGRPIGSFQALKHVIADAHIDREAAWSAVLYAAAALDEGLPDAREAAAVAAAYGARASRRVVESALQVLGGIAFTWEHDVHLLQRRVLSCERRFGDAIAHERWLGDQLAARRLKVAL